MPDPSNSVALVTRNRPDSLERTLASLAPQREHVDEVVISDDSDPGAPADAVRALAVRFGCRYVSGPRRGLYANRNASALACTGTHIRTMDDDHEFPDGHFARCRSAVVDEPATIWIIGEDRPGDPTSAPGMTPPQLHPRGFSVYPRDGEGCWAISDGASIYPRAIFDAGHRFLESFKFGAGYLEWGSRLHALGYRIRHLSGTHVIHHYDEATRSFQDDAMAMGSRFLATALHSFHYQRTPRNGLLTGAEIARQLARRPKVAVPAARMALRAYRAEARPMLHRTLP